MSSAKADKQFKFLDDLYLCGYEVDYDDYCKWIRSKYVPENEKHSDKYLKEFISSCAYKYM